VSRSVGLAHIMRREDGTSEGVWGTYTLKSAFQPIYAFQEGRLKMAAFEGLLRPFRDGEPHRPHDFFLAVPAADRFHIETLSRTLHLLNAGACLDPAASVFINFDPSLFCERELIEATLRDMKLVLHEAHLEPGRVTCEVTEQKSVSQSALMEFVSALRRQGFRIAVDDYGAAESDMERVIALEPDIVKFDARWISRLM
jgi:EAL domain-containing protein (putative c-di-GMP-specific phosphodiesterase class I)